jgi:hypothetical protein
MHLMLPWASYDVPVSLLIDGPPLFISERELHILITPNVRSGSTAESYIQVKFATDFTSRLDHETESRLVYFTNCAYYVYMVAFWDVSGL